MTKKNKAKNGRGLVKVSRKKMLKKFLVKALKILVKNQFLDFVLYLAGFEDIKELTEFLKELFF